MRRGPNVNEIAYTVAVAFPDGELVEPWLHWLRDHHIADVLAGGATRAEIVVLDAPAPTYEVRYRFPSRQAFDLYERDHAPRLRAEGLRLFPVEKGIRYQRSVGVIWDVFPQTG